MASKRCYYEVLEVSRTASDAEISEAYRKLALKYHPDRNRGDEQAVTYFKEAAEAFEVLHDQDKRARYDRFGHAGVEQGGAGGGQFHDLNDIFSAFGDIFGESSFGDIFGGGGRRRGGRVHQGAHVRVEVTLDLPDAARGVNRTLRFQRNERCGTCEGSGCKPGSSPQSCDYCGGVGQVIQSSGFFRVQTTCPSCQGRGTMVKDKCTDCRGTGAVLKQTVCDVQIPGGVDDGQRLCLRGEGDASPDGGPAGDCYCYVHVKEHPLFHREGQHLICQMPISYTQAALGATVEVPTLDGPQELEVPPGTQTGEVFKMSGRGMPHPRHRGKGDLLVQVSIDVPKKLTSKQEELLRELADEEHTHVSPHRKSFLEKLRDFFTLEDERRESEVESPE